MNVVQALNNNRGFFSGREILLPAVNDVIAEPSIIRFFWKYHLFTSLFAFLYEYILSNIIHKIFLSLIVHTQTRIFSSYIHVLRDEKIFHLLTDFSLSYICALLSLEADWIDDRRNQRTSKRKLFMGKIVQKSTNKRNQSKRNKFETLDCGGVVIWNKPISVSHRYRTDDAA